jgi:hypothetical protein
LLRLPTFVQSQATASACYEEGLGPAITRQKFPFCSVLSNGTFVLYWDHALTPGQGGGHPTTITFAVVAKTDADWVALGLSGEAQGMIGVDVAMLRQGQVGGPSCVRKNVRGGTLGSWWASASLVERASPSVRSTGSWE